MLFQCKGKDSKIRGRVVVNYVHYDFLQVKGSLECQNLIVKKDLEINGPRKGQNLKCKNLAVNGEADIFGLEAENFKSYCSLKARNIQIANCLELTGKARIWDGKLNNVELAAERTVFINTPIAGGAIRVKKLQGSWSFFGARSCLRPWS